MVSHSVVPDWDHLDCSPPGSLDHGVSEARILEWVATSFSSGYFWPRDGTHVLRISCIGRQILYHWATWEALFSGDRHQNDHNFHNGLFILANLMFLKGLPLKDKTFRTFMLFGSRYLKHEVLLMNPSFYCSLHYRPINWDESCWGRNSDFIRKVSKWRRWWTHAPREESCPSWNSCFFYNKRGESKVKHFLLPISLWRDVLISSSLQLFSDRLGQAVPVS